eukprot:1850630-Prymnesium_polylepis.1
MASCIGLGTATLLRRAGFQEDRWACQEGCGGANSTGFRCVDGLLDILFPGREGQGAGGGSRAPTGKSRHLISRCANGEQRDAVACGSCLLYTSDAADDM